MNEAKAEKAHKLYEQLYHELQHHVLKFMITYRPTPEQEEYIRTKLNEEMRYWK